MPLLDRRTAGVRVVYVISLTLALGAGLAPFGWSFDQILLLPMVLQLIAWNRRAKRWWLTAGLVMLYAIPFAMRIAQVNEFDYLWVPWLTLGLYWIAKRQQEANDS